MKKFRDFLKEQPTNVTGGVAIGKNLYVCKEIKTF